MKKGSGKGTRPLRKSPRRASMAVMMLWRCSEVHRVQAWRVECVVSSVEGRRGAMMMMIGLLTKAALAKASPKTNSGNSELHMQGVDVGVCVLMARRASCVCVGGVRVAEARAGRSQASKQRPL